jgi:paraquat-inducible protein B
VSESVPSGDVVEIPAPRVKRAWFPFPVVWVLPVLAAVVAGYFVYRHYRERGPEVAVTFADGAGLQAGQTRVTYRGVEIGRVVGVGLSKDLAAARVIVQLRAEAGEFAKEGATYWVVRPDFSLADGITGLGTVVSGPYIAALPGNGKAVKEIDGRAEAPAPKEEGLTIVLASDRLNRLQVGAPVYFRDVAIGAVRKIQLAPDATHVDATALIHKKYAPLVRRNSRFWAVSGADVKGGIFSGLQVKLGTLQQLVSGGIEVATPDEVGEPAQDGDEFRMHDEPKKEWLAWAPKIQVGEGE